MTYISPKRQKVFEQAYGNVAVLVSWNADLAARLSACHDLDTAAAIIAGTDERTNADLAAWRNLGRASS